MNDEERLLHLVSTNLNIPKGRFRGYLKRLGVSDDRVKAAAATFKERQAVVREKPLVVTPLQEGGMYNATVNTGSPIDIRALLATVQSRGLLSSKDFTITECKFKYGRFQTAVTFSGKYAMAGNASKPIVSANFKAKDPNGRGISFDFHKTGKVRFSGSFDPEKVRRFFAQYHAIPGAIQVNNRVVTFRLTGWKPDVSLIHDAFSEPGLFGRFEGVTVKTKFMTKVTKRKTTKLPPSFLYIQFGDEFEAIVTTTGTVQIQGTTDYQNAYMVLKRFFSSLKNNNFLTSGRTKAAPVRVVPEKKTINQPAPNVTRRGTTCPLARRPTPYGFTGACKANCYVKPNPQGQPCCYVTPKKVEGSRNKVEALYVKAGIKVPDAVRQTFGIALTKNKAVEVATKMPELKLNGNKIDSRQCMRYTKVALVDIARRLRLAVPLKVTKPILCQLIKNYKKMPAELLANIRKGKKLVNVKRQLAAAKIQKAFRARVRRAPVKAKSPVRAVAAPAAPTGALRPTRRRAAPPRAPSPVAYVPPKKVVPGENYYKARQGRTRANIYKQLNAMYARGEYADIDNFNYANQAIVEQYYTNKARV
jgi:hypothetical protein